MGRRIAAVAITVGSVVVAGGFRSSRIEAGGHVHGDLGPLAAAVALVMTAGALAVIVAILLPRRPPRRSARRPPA